MLLTPLSIPISRTTMRKMSVLELLFALLLVCLLAGMAGVAFLVWNLVRSADGQARDVAELKLRLEAGGRGQGPAAAGPRGALVPNAIRGRGLSVRPLRPPAGRRRSAG